MIQWTRVVTLSGMTAPHYTDPPGLLAPPPPRRSRIWILLLVVAVGSAVLAAGITAAVLAEQTPTQAAAMAVASPAPSASPTPTPSPSPSTAAPLPTSFSSAMQLVEALNANGLPCGPPEEVAQPSVADTLVDCGPSVVVGTYASHKLAEGAFTVLKSMAASSNIKVHMAIGSNWTVSAGDASYAQQAAKLFAGIYRSTD